MTKLEQVARAQWEQRRRFAARERPELPPLEEWGDGSVPKANGIIEEARAAIEAMREPTMAMVRAAQPPTLSEWYAMVDAALAEVPA